MLAENRHRWGDAKQKVAVRNRQPLQRLLKPLDDALAIAPGNHSDQNGAAAALLRACHRERSAYWGWSAEVWCRILGRSQAEYLQENKSVGRGERQHMIAVAYLLGCFRQLRLLGNYDRASLARKVFGPTAVVAAVQPVEALLSGWGYAAAGNTDLASVVCEALLLNHSPDLRDLTAERLEEFRHECPKGRRAMFRQLSRALAVLGYIDRPLGIASAEQASDTGPQAARDDVHPEWVEWVQRWASTSTLTETTRQGMRTALLKAGRWLQSLHPEVTSPAHWDRDLATNYVAAVDRMRAGDYVGPRAYGRMQDGQSLSPRSKDSYLSAMRVFFADCQAWEWIPSRFDPWRTLATPRSVKALIGPAPRTVAPDVWARLLWAGLTLSKDDLACAKAYPVECVRALALVWLFAGLRSDEIARLRVGCVRRQTTQIGPQEAHETSPGDAVCLLDVPVNKTGTAFTKPVDPVVGEAIDAWESVRPTQPRFPDRKTGEMVHVLFCYRARPMPREYINHGLIPMLCRKADVPTADARGPITSHRARATIASQLFNARKHLTLGELQAWLGHRSPAATQSYISIEPTRLAKAYADAGYLERNVRAIEVLIDQDAIKRGAAAAGEPWRYYDLGHGLCSYEFFDQCPHRMACPGCDFYQAKNASLGLFVEAKSSLLRLLQEVPLTDQERAATEGDLAALQRLTDRLSDQPTPSGQTSKESGPCTACR